jgi:imidazolonepropionase-like amidohydrolase/uncharacterized protein YndB with AHSA1/START domain
MEDVARNQLGGPQNDCTFHAAKDEQNGLGMRQVRIYVVAAAIAFCPAAPHFACGGEQEDTERIALRIERSFAAPRDKVFGLWTDPQAVAQWFLPPENARWTEAPTFAARPGGDFRLRLIAGDELYDLYGTFREVRAPEKLVLNWRWDKDSPLAGSPGDTEVTVEFFARGGRTDLVLTQRGFRNEESRGQYERGWHRCIREMEKLLNFGSPETPTRWKDFIRISSPVVALEHATVIDGTGAPAKQDQTIGFSDGRITALGPSGSVEVPANAKRLDLTGYTALPGLVDMHGHLFYISNFFHPIDLLAHDMPFSYPRLYLASGVTTIRTAGSFEPYTDLDIKKAIDAGTLIGPKVHVTGPYLTGEGYPLVQLYALTGPKDARRMVEYWAREGATSFKLYTDVTRAEAKAAIEEAHRWGLPITGHLCSIGFREAAELGIDNLEHGLWVDAEFAPDKQPDLCPAEFDATAVDLDINGEAIQSMIKTLVDHHVAVTSTIAVWEQFALHPAASERVLGALSERDRKISADGRLIDLKKMTDGTPHEKEHYERFARMLEKEKEFERAFVRAGGLLLAGADAVIDAYIAGFGDQREVELLVEAGFMAEQAIQIASLNGAQFLKEAKRIGSLAPGKQADIMIVKGDPSKNIRDIENVEIVFKDGVGFDSKKLLESVRGQVGIH